MQYLTLLGSTGSIGLSTLDVVSRHPDRFSVFALTAHNHVELMARQIAQFSPQYAVMRDPQAAQVLRQKIAGSRTEVLSGEEALGQVAAASEVNMVVAAIVGAAGLMPTLSAVKAGKKLLLANKESLVMSGALMIGAARVSGAKILPVDSEHNAIFQCLPPDFESLETAGVRRLLLTGSGGPFRNTPAGDLSAVTPQQACAHPNWSMGHKISVDSATMMNKGLEFIEACWLFNCSASHIKVVIHPQSIVHSMVEYVDGSVIAQMGQPDMRTPIAHCLGWPQRLASPVQSLDFWSLGTLEFAEPDMMQFPCLQLAVDAMQTGGTAPAALNAANEVAVAHFLNGHIRFTDIPTTVDFVMQSWRNGEPDDLEAVIHADRAARALAEARIRELCRSHTATQSGQV